MKSTLLLNLLFLLGALEIGHTRHPFAALKADLILKNGNIITIQKRGDRAQAIALKGKTIIAVGADDFIQTFAGSNTRVIDLAGKTVVPGFNDVHQHPEPVFPATAIYAVLRLDTMTSMHMLVTALKDKAARTPKGMLIQGRGYNESFIGGLPVRDSLDKASVDHPILIRHVSGHLSAANSYLIELNHITAKTPDPPGGALGRDKTGKPNGIFKESAASLLYRSHEIKYPPKPSKAEELDGYRLYFRDLLKNGITSVGDAGIGPEKVKIYQELVAEHFPMRFNLLIIASHLDDVLKGKIKRVNNENIRIEGIKVFHGNSLSGKTCWLYAPYDSINPVTQKRDYYGIPQARTQAGLDSLFTKIHSAGLQIACHSNGDKEIDMVLHAIEYAQQKMPRPNSRDRIEHCSITNEAMLERIRRDKVIPVFHCYMYELGDKLEVYGSKRLEMMHPTRQAIKLGIHFALHSDAPVSPYPVMRRLESAVTRKTKGGLVIGASQTIDPEDAIKAYTLEGAYTTFEENKKGNLMAGKLADMLVLNSDPTSGDREHIHETGILMTIMNGNIVYNKNGSE